MRNHNCRRLGFEGLGLIVLIILAAIPRNKSYLGRDSFKYLPPDKDHKGTAKDGADFKNILKHILKSFVDSDNVGGALSKISTQTKRTIY